MEKHKISLNYSLIQVMHKLHIFIPYPILLIPAGMVLIQTAVFVLFIYGFNTWKSHRTRDTTDKRKSKRYLI